MSFPKPLVVVLSRNYSTGLCVIKSLGSVGYPIELVASAAKEGESSLVAKSKYVRNAVEVVSKKVNGGGEEELLQELLDYAGRYDEKPVLIPTDDYTTSVMDMNRDVLEPIFVMPKIFGGEQGCLKRLMDKSVQGEIARKVGILTPKEWVISLRDERIEIPEDMVYPCYCKPLESSLGYKQEMAKCDTEEDLRTHLYALRENFSNRGILVQEFLEIDEEIDLEGVCIDQEIVLPGIVWKRVVAKHDKGVPLEGKTFSLDVLGEFKHKIIAMLKEFHYLGMFDIGFNIVGRDIYFNEMNMRSGGTNYVYFKSGVNLPDIFVKEALGKGHKKEEEQIEQFGKRYFYEKVAWNDYLHDYLSKEYFDKCMEESDILFIYDEDDMEPWNICKSSFDKQDAIKQHRNKLYQRIMDASGCSKEDAVKMVQDAKAAYGVSLNDFVSFSLWEEKDIQAQEISYKKQFERREKNRKLREQCIHTTMEAAGWDRELALEKIKAARAHFNVTYKDFVKAELWKYETVEEQEQAYRKMVEARDNAKTNIVYEELEKPLVVVLSRNYSTGLSVIRSLGAAGYIVDLVASAHKAGVSEIASKSKYVRNYVEVVSRKVAGGGDEELLDALMSYAGKYRDKIVLFPADDYTTSVMDMNRSTLEPYFIMPTIVGGGDGILTMHMDKTLQGEMARNAGLLTPKEWIISLSEEVVIPADMTYPCFCKPIESITGYKKEMAKCENDEELYSHLKKLRRKFAHRSVLVQEFLEIDNEIDLSGVCLDQEIIIPAIIKKTNVAQYEKGVTLAGKVVPFEEMGSVQEAVIKMLKSFHYFGMFDMELNIVGDKIYFNEVNLRSGGPNYSYFMSGVNLPALFVNEALGKGHLPEDEKVDIYGKSFIYEKVAWQDYMNGFMTKRELNARIKSADITLLCNEDDPEPGVLFTQKIKKTAAKKRFKNSVKKIKKSVRPFVNALKTILRPTVHYLAGYPQTRRKNRRNPDAEKPRVLVSGRNYCSNLCMARSLGLAGYEVEILRIFQVKPKKKDLLKRLKPDAFSKYVKAYYVCVSRRNSRRIVDRLIKLADENRKMLLIPADDLIASIADEYFDELSPYYYLPNVNQQAGEINRLMSKEVQKEMAIKAGLPVVNSCVIKTVNGAFDIPDSVTYPCFIKPNISRNSSKSRMRKCDSEEELRGYLTQFSRRKDIEMLVEDFVEIKREYSLLGVSTKDGANGPGLFVAEEGGQAEHRGVALIGRIMNCDDMQPLVDNLIKFTGSLGFTGLYDIDLIETVSGQIYFVEINMRFGASGFAVTKSGVNLPGMFADYMLFNKSIDLKAQIDKAGKKFVSEKILIDEYAKGRIEKSKISESMDAVDVHFIKDEKDSKPYRHFKRYYLIASLLRPIYIKKELKKAEKEGK